MIAAAMAWNGTQLNGGGPVWAIFDSAAAERESWTLAPPHVDPEGWFFSAPTLEALAQALSRNRHQRSPMAPEALAESVRRYNGFVDRGADADFGGPAPRHRLERPPYHAAWATPMAHGSLAGIRIDARCRVIDLDGVPIPRLYCAGESAGGFMLHGLARCLVQGRIAAINAAAERAES